MIRVFIPLHSSIQNLTKCPEFKGFYLENKYILYADQITADQIIVDTQVRFLTYSHP